MVVFFGVYFVSLGQGFVVGESFKGKDFLMGTRLLATGDSDARLENMKVLGSKGVKGVGEDRARENVVVDEDNDLSVFFAGVFKVGIIVGGLHRIIEAVLVKTQN
jgi:hypothetical protein